MSGEHNFAKRVLAFPIKHITFLHPKRLQRGSFLPFLLALVALLAVQLAIFPLPGLYKKGRWLESHAHFAYKAPSATTIARITPASLWILYAIHCFLCIFTVSYTLFFSNSHIFGKKTLPALGGKHDFESGCSAKSWNKCHSGPANNRISAIFAPLIAPWFFQKKE